MASTLAVVRQLKAHGEDFEWYPTTDEILSVIKQDIAKIYAYGDVAKVSVSVLDVGCGDGRALNYLTNGNKYGIEKSGIHLSSLDKAITVVGTDFFSQTLIDKKCKITFSNPMYSCFGTWSEKIILEANSEFVYLVVPTRWRSDRNILQAIQARKATYEVIGRADFLSADRQARTNVDIVRIALRSYKSGGHFYAGYGDSISNTVDPFDLWFSTTFKVSTRKSKLSEWEIRQEVATRAESAIRSEEGRELVRHRGLVHVLYDQYNREMNSIMEHYTQIAQMDPVLLNELNISLDAVLNALRFKIGSVKDIYWQKLFDSLDTITSKLTSSTRKKLLDQLTDNTKVDFTPENAFSIITWAIKHANHYFDEQVIEVVKSMVSASCVIAYKSNDRVFKQERWRYLNGDYDRYKLDYRIVNHVHNAIVSNQNERNPSCLSESARNFINDILTIAQNLRFDTLDTTRAEERVWQRNEKQEFYYRNHSLNQDVLLFDCRAFENGNIHLRFNTDFICALNIEFGRLSGWIKSKEDAADELDIPLQVVEKFYHCNRQLLPQSTIKLINKVA